MRWKSLVDARRARLRRRRRFGRRVRGSAWIPAADERAETACARSTGGAPRLPAVAQDLSSLSEGCLLERPLGTNDRAKATDALERDSEPLSQRENVAPRFPPAGSFPGSAKPTGFGQ